MLISLGASRSRLILRNLLLDLGVFLGELGLTVLLLHRYTAENYQRPIVMGILVGFFCVQQFVVPGFAAVQL